MEDKEIEQLAEQYLLPLRQYCQDGQSEALCYNGFVDGFKKAQELLSDKWISVDERLPYKDGNSSIYCLVNTTRDGILVRPYNEYHICWDDEDADDHFTDAKGGLVTHWQPIPSPPQLKDK